MTDTDRARALYLAAGVSRYCAHLESCSSRTDDSNPASDYCDCGYSNAAKAYEELTKIIARA